MKLEINYKKKNRKRINPWRLNKLLLNNEWVNEEIKEEIRKHLNTNENGNTALQNKWNVAKAVVRGKFRGIPSLKVPRKKKK